MKLLIILPSHTRGGAEEHALTIASAVAKQGWQVHVGFPRTGETLSLIDDFLAKGVSYYPLRSKKSDVSGFRAKISYFVDFVRTVYHLKFVFPFNI